jgi:RimJ/RimL family protein N-acetyltransferase
MLLRGVSTPGKSTKRAVAIRIRSATLADARFLFRLRNDPVTRQNSFQQRKLEFSDHRAWLRARLADPKRRVTLFIASVAGPGGATVPIGLVRFDGAERSNRAEISIALAARFRGRGFAAPMLRRALGRAPSWIERVLARVRVENAASVRAFERAEFRRHGGVRARPNPHFVLLWRRPAAARTSQG